MEIPVDKFFDTCIDGYLFSDLENMMTLGPIPHKHVGAAGYPILITMMSGMELLGSLMQPTSLLNNKGFVYTGETQFIEYWNKYLVPTDGKKYSNMGSAVYNLIRHGIAHTSMGKVGIIVTKQGDDPEWHMKMEKNSISNEDLYSLNINVIKLFEDFMKSYNKFSADRKASLKDIVQNRLDEIINSDISQTNKFLGPLYNHMPDALLTTQPSPLTSISTSSNYNLPIEKGSISALPLNNIENL